MDLWSSIGGMVRVTLTSAEPEQALAEIAAQGVEMRNIHREDGLTYGFLLGRKALGSVEALCIKRGDTLTVRERKGIFWAARQLLYRPMLAFTMLFFFLAVLFLPGRIFFVRVEGNELIPSAKILEAAEQCGICFGASRREVRSERVKNALLSQVPQLQWVGVNTAGCVAAISVREKSLSEEAEEAPGISSITAVRDGYVVAMTVESGDAQVQPGQTVEEGQVLISGYTDCGDYIRGARARGEVMAQTNRDMTLITPGECLQKTATGRKIKKYSLLIRKKRINLWKDSGILDSSCGRMYEKYYITLPGGFSLPVALCVDTYDMYTTQRAVLPQPEAEESMKGAASRYVTGQMIAGEILSQSFRISEEKGLLLLHAGFNCMEMIGRERQEGIGDTNGKDS